MPPKSVGTWYTVNAWFRVRVICCGCDAVTDSDMYINLKLYFIAILFFSLFDFLLCDRGYAFLLYCNMLVTGLVKCALKPGRQGTL